MNSTEKVNVCSKCKYRKFTMQNGIVCGLTDAKPAFEDECDSYVEDPSEASLAESYNGEESVADVLADTEEKLPGSSWFKTIGWLSLLNIVLNMLGVSFIFGLGLTQIAQVGIEFDIVNGLLGWTTILGLPLIMIYTWWMTAKSSSRVAYVIGMLIYLFDAYVSYWLWDLTGDSSLIIDLVIHAALLVYFIYHFATYSGKIQKPETETAGGAADKNLLMYVGVAAVVMFVAFSTFAEFKEVFEILASLSGY